MEANKKLGYNPEKDQVVGEEITVTFRGKTLAKCSF